MVPVPKVMNIWFPVDVDVFATKWVLTGGIISGEDISPEISLNLVLCPFTFPLDGLMVRLRKSEAALYESLIAAFRFNHF